MIVTKDEMCAAALELFREHGYKNVNIPLICRKCGVTKGSFYHHFRSKEDLLTYWLSQKVYAVGESAEEQDLPPKEQLLSLLHRHALLIRSIGCDLFYNAMVADMNNQGAHLLAAMGNVSGVVDLVARAMETGETAAPTSARNLLGCYIMAVLGAIMEWKMAEGRTDIVECLDDLARIIFR